MATNPEGERLILVQVSFGWRSEMDAELLCAFHQRYWLPLMNLLAAVYALSFLALLKIIAWPIFAC